MVFEYFSSEAREARKSRREPRRRAADRAGLEARRNWLAHEYELLSKHQDIADEFDVDFVTKRGEEVLLVVHDLALIETRSAGARYRGKSMGATVRVAKGVYLRPGVHGGKIERQPEELKEIDVGTFTVTTLRCMFAGSRQTRTWDYSKLVAIDYSAVHEGRPAVLIPVENRQKNSGVVVTREVLRDIQSRLGFATALHAGTEDRYLAAWAEDIAELNAEIAGLADP